MLVCRSASVLRDFKNHSMTSENEEFPSALLKNILGDVVQL